MLLYSLHSILFKATKVCVLVQASRPLRERPPGASGGVRVTRVTREVEVAEVVVAQPLPAPAANGPLVS